MPPVTVGTITQRHEQPIYRETVADLRADLAIPHPGDIATVPVEGEPRQFSFIPAVVADDGKYYIKRTNHEALGTFARIGDFTEKLLDSFTVAVGQSVGDGNSVKIPILLEAGDFPDETPLYVTVSSGLLDDVQYGWGAAYDADGNFVPDQFILSIWKNSPGAVALTDVVISAFKP